MPGAHGRLGTVPARTTLDSKQGAEYTEVFCSNSQKQLAI